MERYQNATNEKFHINNQTIRVVTASRKYLRIVLQVTYREITSRYLGTISGGVWALLHPAILLLIYSLVFVEFFKARVGATSIEFITFFAMGLWPWTAFSESISRSLNAVPENAALLTKIKLPSWIIILAPLLATQLLHLLGFLLVCVALKIFGYEIHLLNTVMCVIPLLMLAALAFSISMIFASINVFVRDVSQVIPQLLALTFFLTPIMYSSEVIPKKYLSLMDYNPVTPWIDWVRSLMLGLKFPDTNQLTYSSVVIVVLMCIGAVIYKKLSPHFEDFI